MGSIPAGGVSSRNVARTIISGFQPGNMGSNPVGNIGERAMKKYEANLETRNEACVILTEDGKKIDIKYRHRPNAVGPRSNYKGLPIWVGETEATATLDNGTEVTAVAKCWLKEPFTYSRGRVVSTGRLLKELGLPTKLAMQVE